MTILLISTCKEKLHNLEFVEPIKRILIENSLSFITKNYKEIKYNDLREVQKVIICGTSLRDEDYLKHLKNFNWIKNFSKPILGICAGAQILSLVYNGKIKSVKEIGQIEINFLRQFLKQKGKIKSYALHSLCVESKEFEIYAKLANCPQAIKHKSKPFYGVLFHPEVMNKEMVLKFCRL